MKAVVKRIYMNKLIPIAGVCALAVAEGGGAAWGGPIEFHVPMQLQHTRSGLRGIGERLKHGGVLSGDNENVLVLGIDLNTIRSYPRTVLRSTRAEHPDGGFVCLGDANQIVWRIRADGTRDESFVSPPVGTFSIVNFSVQSDGKVLAGCFPPESLVRFNANGSYDDTFTFSAGPNVYVQETIPLAGGKVLVRDQERILRLLPSGQLDPTFHIPTFSSFIRDMEVQADGKIVAVGEFGSVDGIPAGHMVRLEESGQVDFGFTPLPRGEGTGEKLRIQTDGRIVVKYPQVIFRFMPNGESDLTFSFSGVGQTLNGFEVDYQDRIYASTSSMIWQYSGRYRVIALPTDAPMFLERSPLIDSGWTLLQNVPANTQYDFLINDFPGTGSTFYRTRPAQ